MKIRLRAALVIAVILMSISACTAGEQNKSGAVSPDDKAYASETADTAGVTPAVSPDSTPEAKPMVTPAVTHNVVPTVSPNTTPVVTPGAAPSSAVAGVSDDHGCCAPPSPSAT